MELMMLRLAILEGADQAVVAGVQSFDAMFPYQNAAIDKLHLTGSMTAFYGSKFEQKYTNTP